jgi:phosphoribosylamine--glycine ligase
MKILVVGNGGREHAILWKLRRDDPNARLFVTSGNGGMAGLAESVALKPNDVAALGEWAAKEKVDLTIVGPEIPLADGIVDHFERLGLPIFGPSRAAAEIESSKAFAKSLMLRHGIPTAGFAVFTEPESAVEYIETVGGPLVVKASGLAAGKGAVVCMTTAEAVDAARGMLSGTLLGQAGERLVVEDFMEGEELSVFALCDGVRFVTLPAAQDHKTIGEGDTGPNTGGMGAYTPVSVAKPDIIGRIEAEVIRPTLEAMAAEGRPYRGVLYAGLMLTEAGPKVVEFNCRFGDPEAQVVIPMLRSSLFDLLLGAATGALPSPGSIEWRSGAALTTVMASGGYPGEYATGVPIELPADLVDREDIIVFHAGTRLDGGRLVTAGGRVLAITAFGDSVIEAADRSREAAESIHFEGRTFRRDIGWREMRRLRSPSMP